MFRRFENILVENFVKKCFEKKKTFFIQSGAPVAFALLTEFLPSSVRASVMVWFNLFWTFGTISEAGL